MVRRNVYINGLPNYFRSNDLRELCKVYGQIEASKLCASHHGPTAKSYGFVLFYTEEDAEQCITQLDGSRLCGQRLQARYADSKATPLPSHPSSLQTTRSPLMENTTHDQWLVSSAQPTSHATINASGDGDQFRSNSTERMKYINTKKNNKKQYTTIEAELEKVRDANEEEVKGEKDEKYAAFPMQHQTVHYSRGNSPDLMLPTQELKKGYRLANIMRNSHNKRGSTQEFTAQRSPLFEGRHSVFSQTGSTNQSCPSTPHHLENPRTFISRATLSPSPPPTLMLPAATSSLPQHNFNFVLESENGNNMSIEPIVQVRRGSVQSFHGSARNSPVPHIITQQSPESHSLHVRSPIAQSLQVQYKEPHTTRNYKTMPPSSSTSASTLLPTSTVGGVGVNSNNNIMMGANALSASANSINLNNNNNNNNQTKRTSSPPNSSDLHEFITLHAQTPNHLQMLHQRTNPTKDINSSNNNEATKLPPSTLPSSTATPAIPTVRNNALLEALMLHAQQLNTQNNTTSTNTDNKNKEEAEDTTNTNTTKNEDKNKNDISNEAALAVNETQANTSAPITSPLLSQYVYVPINLALLASLQTQLQESASSASLPASLINPSASLVLSNCSTSLPASCTVSDSTNASANDTDRCSKESVNLTNPINSGSDNNAIVDTNTSISNNSTTTNINVTDCTKTTNTALKDIPFNAPEAANPSSSASSSPSSSSSAYAHLLSLSLPTNTSSVLPTSAPALSQSNANTTNTSSALPIIMIDPTTGAAFASLNPLSQ